MNFVTLKIIKQNGVKFVIFVIRNVIEIRGIEIGIFGVMKVSFLENEVTKKKSEKKKKCIKRKI